ncbi:MAG: hypothetical protein HOV94_11930 [Saccharothrix sp.]|nr:hypothetical protein [Saccharothrix sp.]
MPGFAAMYERWLAWVDGRPRPAVHRGVRDPVTGGVTDDGADPWKSPDLLPGDLVAIRGEPLQNYTAAVDPGVRRTVDLVNRHVGATVASCEGHGNDVREHPSLRRFVRVVADDIEGIDRATGFLADVVAGHDRSDTPGVALGLTRRYIDTGAGGKVPMVTLHFMPTESGDAAYWAQLDRATAALDTRIEERAAREPTRPRGHTAGTARTHVPVSAPTASRRAAIHRTAAQGLDSLKHSKHERSARPARVNTTTSTAIAAASPLRTSGAAVGLDKDSALEP